MILWQPAHEGCVRCATSRSLAVGSWAFDESWTTAKLTFGGGSGTSWHRNNSRMALPRSVADERPGWEYSARNATCDWMPSRWLLAGNLAPSQPLRVGTGSR